MTTRQTITLPELRAARLALAAIPGVGYHERVRGRILTLYHRHVRGPCSCFDLGDPAERVAAWDALQSILDGGEPFPPTGGRER